MASMKSLLFHQGGAAAVQHALVIGVLSLAVLAGSLALRASLIVLYDDVGERAGEALSVGEGETAGETKGG